MVDPYTTRPPTHRAAHAFESLLDKIRATADREGPAAAARLCDRKADELETVLEHADDPSTRMLPAIWSTGFLTADLEDWVSELRRQSQQLRRGFA